MKKALSLLLTLALMLSLVPATALAYSEAYGSEVWLRDTALHNGVAYSDNIYWSNYYSQLRQEHYFTYTPSRQVTPVAAYGQAVCDRLTGIAAAQIYEAKGYRVVGAINGDYYDTATGFPLGLLVSEGEILSGSGNYYAVGFRADGSAVMGAPGLTITAQSGAGSHELSSINKPRAENGGVTLLTYDFRNDHTTGTTTQGVNVLCTILSGKAGMGQQMLLRVDRVTEDTQAVAIMENQVVLTAAATAAVGGVDFLRSLQAGTTVTVSFAAADPKWNDVTAAIGALHLLVDNGQIQSGLEAGNAPRTAIGLKASGEVVFYTVDGRQTGYSMGASMKVMAQRLMELGCVTAVCLDGGGSTTAVASMPDSVTAQVVNSPSDKSQRKVSNHLLLLAPGQRSNIASHIYLAAENSIVLPGRELKLSTSLVDTNYFPMNQPVSLTATAGQIIGNTFLAPAQGGPVTITATSGGKSASIQVTVVDTPDELAVRWDGSTVGSSVTMFPGDKAELTASAIYNHLPLDTTAADFTWTVDPHLGTMENGVLTTKYMEGSGNVTVSMGAKSVTIPLTLDADSPFVDTEKHWGGTYMAKLYHKGILSGVPEKDGLYAYPDKGVTRAEFAVLLSRYLGLTVSDYAAVEVPFTDMDKVDPWAADAVRAMYALGIINGVAQKDGTMRFEPKGKLNRSQAVTMLGRAGLAEAQRADLSQFTDAKDIMPYAREHFETMVALGVIGGSYGKLNPNGTMTRAEISKVLTVMP